MRIDVQKSKHPNREKLLFCFTILLLTFALAPAQGDRATQSMTSAPATEKDTATSFSKTLSCLPKDVRADEAVSFTPKGKENLTVERKLIEMKARCRRGKLVDSRSREIRFFRPSCWGNPPVDYQEIQQRERDELAKLKKRFTVITFSCNPMIQ